jgi:hypothetical protein
MPGSFVPNSDLRFLTYGRKVDRAAATIPQTAAQTIFNVTGGRILVTALVGTVTTVIGGTATTLKVTSTPTSGTAVDVASATAITSKEVGAIATLPGTAGSALVVNNAGGGGQIPGHQPYIVPPGALSVTTSASTTGAMSWSLMYVPLDDGVTVTAA